MADIFIRIYIFVAKKQLWRCENETTHRKTIWSFSQAKQKLTTSAAWRAVCSYVWMVLHILDIEFEVTQPIGDACNFGHLGKYRKAWAFSHHFVSFTFTNFSSHLQLHGTGAHKIGWKPGNSGNATQSPQTNRTPKERQPQSDLWRKTKTTTTESRPKCLNYSRIIVIDANRKD